MFNRISFGIRIKELRNTNNISQITLIKAIGGDSKSTISKLESGERSPSVETLVSLADYFGVSIDYLTGRTDNPKVYK